MINNYGTTKAQQRTSYQPMLTQNSNYRKPQHPNQTKKKKKKLNQSLITRSRSHCSNSQQNHQVKAQIDPRGEYRDCVPWRESTRLGIQQVNEELNQKRWTAREREIPTCEDDYTKQHNHKSTAPTPSFIVEKSSELAELLVFGYRFPLSTTQIYKNLSGLEEIKKKRK